MSLKGSLFLASEGRLPRRSFLSKDTSNFIDGLFTLIALLAMTKWGAGGVLG
jgi:hypothetical protein